QMVYSFVKNEFQLHQIGVFETDYRFSKARYWAFKIDSFLAKMFLPKFHGSGRNGEANGNRFSHAGLSLFGQWPGKKSEPRTGIAIGISVEKMIGARIVLVY